MKYLGNIAEQDIKCNNYKTLYEYTSKQQREVVLYYDFVENCFVLKQFAICSKITKSYSMYWVFLHDYVNDDFYEFKKTCMEIVENEVLPHIKNCVENNIPISDGLC